MHVDHFRRADADEILVTSRLASRLLARSALYPGLTELVTDIVSGGEGSELYRVDAARRRTSGCRSTSSRRELRGEHHATLLAVTRDGRSLIEPAGRLPARRPATTRWWWPRASASCARSSCSTSRPCRQRDLDPLLQRTADPGRRLAGRPARPARRGKGRCVRGGGAPARPRSRMRARTRWLSSSAWRATSTPAWLPARGRATSAS